MQNWHFVVVTDPSQRGALAELYRKSTRLPGGQEDMLNQMIAAAANEQEAAQRTKMAETPRYFNEHLHEIPVHVIPCIEGRAENLPAVERAGQWGGILPAT
jgi:hypothetical protein